MGMSHRPIFVVGSPRSGTALLRDLLRAHPRITFPGESHFIPLFYRAYGNPQTDRDARALGGRILQLRWVKRWRLDLEPDSFRDCRSFRAVIETLYEAWATMEGKERWGDKTPQYYAAIPVLRSIFPESQFIHIYRDGRDTALSILAAGFGPQNVYAAAVGWRRDVRTARRAGAALSPDAYFEVRYEDVLTAPEETMRGVLDFLGEPFDEAVLRPNFLERDARAPVIGQQERAYVSRTEIVATNRDKWKTQMEATDLRLFESVAGDLLEELGYETIGDRRPIPRFEEARWKTDHRLRWAVRRLNTRQKSFRTAWLMFRAKSRLLLRARSASSTPPI